MQKDWDTLIEQSGNSNITLNYFSISFMHWNWFSVTFLESAHLLHLIQYYEKLNYVQHFETSVVALYIYIYIYIYIAGMKWVSCICHFEGSPK